MSGVLFFSGIDSFVCFRGMCEIGEQWARKQKAVSRAGSGAGQEGYKITLSANEVLFSRLLLVLPTAFRFLLSDFPPTESLRFNQAVISVLPLVKHSQAAGVGISKYQELIGFAR
jgi:hypothetical protein